MDPATDDRPIVEAPPPWACKATIYMFAFYHLSSSLQKLPSFSYSPLEAASSFTSGTPVGGLGMVQLLRYTESPMGPYDEMIIAPGYFEHEVDDPKGNGTKIKRRNAKVSRIYVSQKHTCWSGRTNWNLPKHLARFEFDDLPNGGIAFKVFPHDTTGHPTDSFPSLVPFFTARYAPLSYMPSFPLSISILRYFGTDINLVQPPLPAGRGSLNELPGTQRWCKICPVQYTDKANIGWFDLKQEMSIGKYVAEQEPLLAAAGDTDDQGIANSEFENWWPGFGRWRLGLKMVNANLQFDAGEHWV